MANGKWSSAGWDDPNFISPYSTFQQFCIIYVQFVQLDMYIIYHLSNTITLKK